MTQHSLRRLGIEPAKAGFAAPKACRREACSRQACKTLNRTPALHLVDKSYKQAYSLDTMLILADEPTGNLDSKASDEIAARLRQAANEQGRAVVMVTHDPRIAA